MTEPRIPTTKIGRTREWLAAAREGATAAAITTVVVILLFWPSHIGRIAKEAGIKAAFGVEFLEELEKSKEKTIAALDEAKDLSSKSTQFRARLQEISKEKQPNPEAVKNLAKDVDAIEKQSHEVKKSLENSLQAQRDIIKRIGK